MTGGRVTILERRRVTGGYAAYPETVSGFVRAGVRAAASVAAVAVVTGAVFALRPVAPVVSLGVLYLLAVLPVAVLWGLGYALPVAVASMLAFEPRVILASVPYRLD